MRKFYSLFIALLTVCGLAKAQVVFDFANNNLDLPVSATGTEDEGNVTEISSEGVTITFDKGTASTNSRLWSASGNITLRVYKGSTFTVSADENITSIVFGGQASNFGLDADPEGLNGQTWTGSAKSITFSPTKTNQIRTITVTVGEGGGDTPDPDPQPTIDWTSSATAPLTVAQLQEKAAQLEGGANSGKDVYVKGKISQIDEISPKLEDGSGFGNATYYISDDGTTTNQFYVFRGKGLKGADFTSADEIKVGDEVVVVGVIKNYVKGETSTLEFDQGNILYSLNGDTGGDDPQPGDSKTIAQVIAGGAATGVLTSGTVYASCPNGVIIGDGTGYIYAYKPSVSAEVGDVVKITGNVSQYGGCFQFGQGCTLEKTGTASVNYPAVKEIDGAGLDALIEAPAVTYVKVKGTLTVSGNYKNLTVEGASNKGSLQVSDAVLGSAGDGDEVEVTGFFAYKSGSSTVYGNIVATEVKVVGDTPDPEAPVYTTIAAVKDAVTTEHVNVVFKANDLLVTFVNGKNVYVYDGKDGLLLFANDASLNEGIKAGDKITADVKGQLYLYNGLTEIAVSAYENLTVNSSDNAVEPQKVTVADVTNNSRDYENELVQIEGLYAQAEALASRNINFMDDSDNEIIVRDNWNVLTGTTFDTESEYTVTAFVALYTKDGATTVQLYPRTAEDVTNGETPKPYEFTGDGSLENPYTVEDIQHKEATSTKEALEAGVWVKAYIVGYINGSSLSESTAIFSADAPEGTDKDDNPLTVTVSNIIVADAAGASAVAAVIPVGTVNKSVARENLNLADNPGMLGQQVWLKGDIFKYMGVSGLKNVSEYSLNGSDIVTAISTVEAAAVQGAIYTIAGQRIQHINHAGLYIVGGKKVAVK